MRKNRANYHIDSLLALLLFGVFAVCILSVLLTGADAYRRLTQRDQEAYDRRVCAQYVAAKVRQTPSAHQVSVGSFGSVDALMLSQEIGGETYLTRIYCFDGWLRELFSAAGDEMLPEDGEKILPLRDLSPRLEDGLLSISMTDETGSAFSLLLSPRGGEGVGQ